MPELAYSSLWSAPEPQGRRRVLLSVVFVFKF